VNFTAQLNADAVQIAAYLDRALRGLPDAPVSAAMRYAATGGKRLRGFLVLESARMLGVDGLAALPAAGAIEALHAYSLVHDDLPCMDDDDLRRGLPTVHVKWDQATAVLAGDGLQSVAFEMLSDPAVGTAQVRAALTLGLARAAGAMVQGQAMDIAAESADMPLTLAQITQLQAGKTGALISWSATAGAVMAGADPAPLARYAAALGLAFQIADDILDVTGDAAQAGKRLGKDAAAGKATFVLHLGLGGAQERAHELADEAAAALEIYGARADNLIAAARFAVARER
jgi:farnesyl diphosphate synthase